MLVCTVGEIRVWPGASNVISSNTNFTVDIRSRSDQEREGVVKSISGVAKRACFKRDMVCRVDLKHEAPAANCDAQLIIALNEAIVRARGDDETDLTQVKFTVIPEILPLSVAQVMTLSPYIQLVLLECYL